MPGDIAQNTTIDGRTEAGALNVWLTPHGFLKGAALNAVQIAELLHERGLIRQTALA